MNQMHLIYAFSQRIHFWCTNAVQDCIVTQQPLSPLLQCKLFTVVCGGSRESDPQLAEVLPQRGNCPALPFTGSLKWTFLYWLLLANLHFYCSFSSVSKYYFRTHCSTTGKPTCLFRTKHASLDSV
jgi:hypothetical protein